MQLLAQRLVRPALLALGLLFVVSLVTADEPKKMEPPTPAPATVYTAKTGTKYHTSTCQYVRKNKNPIAITAAKAKGLEPCSVCKPRTE